MSFDPNANMPKSTTWFTPDVEYEGWGTAIFSSPAGTIEGTAKARFNRFGEVTITLTIEKFTSSTFEDIDDPHKYSYFFSAVEYETHGNNIPHESKNPCEHLTISTPNGTFTPHAKYIRYGYASESEGNIISFDFDPPKSNFECSTQTRAKYFVLPLYNFVAGFMEIEPELDQHPLRINTTNRQLIVSNYNNNRCFIERLPDYEEYKAQLENGTCKCVVTSILVGNVGENEITDTNLKILKVPDLLSLLSLVTGRQVNSPWLEIRDEQGELIRRLHLGRSVPTFRKGTPIFQEGIFGLSIRKGYIGKLINQAQSSSDFGKPYLRAAISQVVIGGYDEIDDNIEDTLAHFYRGLDAICEEFRLKSIRSIEQYLSEDNAKIANEIIESASTSIGELTSQIAGEYDALNGLSKRILNTKTEGISYSKGVQNLLDKFGFPDAKICDKYFKLHPGFEGEKRWTRLIAAHRGKAIHHAWYDWEDNPPNINEVGALTFHLRDLLVRIILKILGYDGEYSSVILHSSYLKLRQVNWVTEKTSARDLGYGIESRD